MNPVTLKDHWGGVDELDGKPLQDGEPLLIRWPNGREETVSAQLESRVERVSEQGGLWNCAYEEAFVSVELNGVQVSIKLRDSGILAERVPAGVGNA